VAGRNAAALILLSLVKGEVPLSGSSRLNTLRFEVDRLRYTVTATALREAQGLERFETNR